MKTVLITGAAGFVGTHLSNLLANKGFRVIGVDDLSKGSKKGLSGKVIFKKIDVLDIKKLSRLFDGYKVDYLIHLAALTSKLRTDRFKVFKVNTQGTKNINLLCIKHKVKKLVFASSAAIYNPINSYGDSKLAAEKEITAPHSILRFSNIYGYGQRTDSEGGVISIFAERLNKGLPLTIYGDGRQIRDFVYIDDVIQAIYKSMLYKKDLKINVSTGVGTSINSLVKLMEEMWNKKVKINYKTPKLKEIGKSVLNNSKMKKLLRFTPNVKLKRGLQKLASKI